MGDETRGFLVFAILTCFRLVGGTRIPPALSISVFAAVWRTVSPHVLIDVSRPGAVEALQALFRGHADETGRKMDPRGLRQVLDMQRAADGLNVPFPDDYVASVFETMQTGTWEHVDQKELSEDVFLSRFPIYLKHREYLWRAWLLDFFELPGPSCKLPGARGLCCSGELGHKGYEPCFDETYTFELCCGTLDLPPANELTSEEELAGEKAAAVAAAWAETASPVFERNPLFPVAAAEQGRAALAGCAEMACTCVARPERESRGARLAVLVVGVRQRFYPLTTLRHVVGAATKDGFDVDYFVMLNWNPPRQAKRPRLNSKTHIASRPNPMFANASKVAMQDYVTRLARRYGARRIQIHLMDPGVFVDPLPPSLNRWFGRENKGHPAYVHYLQKLKKIELLWNRTGANISGSQPYSHVIVVRDDVHWLEDIRLADFADPWTVYSPPMGFLCQRPHRPETPAEHVFVMGGQTADRLLRAYTEYYNNPSPELDAVDSTEQYWYVLARLLGIRWEMVKRSRLPYLLSMHMTVDSAPVFCLRGISRAILQRPTASCVHPALVRFEACDDVIPAGA